MQLGGRDLATRDLIAVATLIILVLTLIGSGVWLRMRAKQTADAKAPAAAAQAAQPRRAPPITTSVYVRAVPVRHAQ